MHTITDPDKIDENQDKVELGVLETPTYQQLPVDDENLGVRRDTLNDRADDGNTWNVPF